MLLKDHNYDDSDLSKESFLDFAKRYFMREQDTIRFIIRFFDNRVFIQTREGLEFSCPCNAVSVFNPLVDDFAVCVFDVSNNTKVYVKTDYFNNNDILIEIFEYCDDMVRNLLTSGVMQLDGFQDGPNITFI